ncbi:MAG: prolipoprotein diacylglyceryl transferase, partial [Firmicutes bacterium]|nr:prolipoprotein diacylglyceryl transferase [Bacillota bacterium]
MLAVSPIAFSIGGLTVRWYGIMIVLGMAAGIWLAGKLAQKQGYQEDEILNLYAPDAMYRNAMNHPEDAVLVWQGYKKDI